VKWRAILVLGLGCVLFASHEAQSQQIIKLGAPQENTDTLPRLLLTSGTKTAGQGDDASIIAVPGNNAPSAPRVVELPMQISPRSGSSTYMENVVVPEFELVLTVGVPRLVFLKQNVERAQIGGGDEKNSPAVLGITNNRELTLLGRKVGRTILNLWFADPYVSGRYRIVSYHVKIEPDIQCYRDMEKTVKKRFPRSHVELQLSGNNLLVTGQAHNAAEAARILQIFKPAAEPPIRSLPETVAQSSYCEPSNEPRQLLNVVNMLKIEPDPQVMLKLVVTEVNRTAVNRLGLDVPSDKSLATLLTSTQLAAAVNNLREAKLARTLYETTLVASCGQAAKLQEGGLFAAPSASSGSSPSAQYFPFGLSVVFVPTITDHDEIQLNVEGEVTTRDFSSHTRMRGTFLPNLTKRTFQSIVEVHEGRCLALAGVTQHNTAVVRQRSFLGRLPLVGGLFTEIVSGDEQELIITVTPQLLNPDVANAPLIRTSQK
jgi:pilus assembly protein CpaC